MAKNVKVLKMSTCEPKNIKRKLKILDMCDARLLTMIEYIIESTKEVQIECLGANV